MLYKLYEMTHAALVPARLGAELTKMTFDNPWNPLRDTPLSRTLIANATLFERVTRRFGKPEFMLHETKIGGKTVDVEEDVVAEEPFCRLIHFKRDIKRNDPKVLLVAPMSGHFSTLLRGTVEALLPHHDVYITDWTDARQVSMSEGSFSLDDYISYLIKFMSLLGPQTHVIAVCQPAVPVFAAISLMEAEEDPNAPLTMTLMGGPIDPRVSKTQVTALAEERPLSWFENNVCYRVPYYYPGAHRRVYPGFIQLSGFMSMNLDHHIGSHLQFYEHLVAGDGDSTRKHQEFYNEYLSVMDIDASFYLQTVETVFQKHSLPKGKMVWHDKISGHALPVKPESITHTALLTVEGEMDDISACGQTTAAHDLATQLDPSKKFHHFQENVGHYGIFNGRRWQQHIMPRIRHFIRQFDDDTISPIPQSDLKQIADKQPVRWDKDKYGVRAITKWRKEKEARKEKESVAGDA